MIELYIEYGVAALATILLAISWLYSRLLADKIKGNRTAQLVVNVGQELRAVITEVNNTYVKALKDAGQDGEWTKKEMSLAKTKAVDKFKENWGPRGIKRMARGLGIGGAIDSWLGTQVEATLTDMKDAELPWVATTHPKE